MTSLSSSTPKFLKPVNDRMIYSGTLGNTTGAKTNNRDIIACQIMQLKIVPCELLGKLYIKNDTINCLLYSGTKIAFQ